MKIKEFFEEIYNKRYYLLLSTVIVCVIFGGIYFYLHSENKVANREAQKILSEYTTNGYLIYGADKSAPPLRFIDDDGVYKGVVVDYMNQLSLELGVEIKAEPYLWEDALEALKNGEIDFADMFINPERSKHYVFTDPIYYLRTVLAVKSTSSYTLEDVNNLTIATQKGDYANDYLMTYYPDAKLVFVPDVQSALMLLQENKVDGVIGDEPVVYYHIGRNPEYKNIKMINTALYEEPVVIAMPKTHAKLVPILNDAIEEIGNKGVLEKIQQKWFGISTPLLKEFQNKKQLRFLIFCVIITMVMIIFIGYNNRILKHQVKNRTRDLEASRNELRNIFDGIPEFMVVINSEKKIVNANQAILNQLKLPINQILGNSCKDVLLPYCGNCENCLIDQCRHQQREIKKELNLLGEIYEIKAYPISGIENGSIVTLRNVTMELIQRKQLLRSSKMMAVGQLAAGMAHEIRNPLGIIRTQSYLLQNNNSLNTNAIKSLNHINDSVSRAGKIIDNIMNFWREDNSNLVKINLFESINAIISLQNDKITSISANITLDCDKDITIFTNGEAIKHILINLLDNALDAIKIGGNIKIKGYFDNHNIIIECQDDGCGIAQEALDNIFNPFFTTKEPGKGTGLGLFIVYSEVEKLLGNIYVESTLNKGTLFKISMPEGRKE